MRKIKVGEFIRNGDTGLLRIAALPDGDSKPASNVVALGEVTGHAHVIEMKEGVNIVEIGGVRYLNALVSTRIKHEEHKWLPIPAGVYEIRDSQRQYQRGEIKRVVD